MEQADMPNIQFLHFTFAPSEYQGIILQYQSRAGNFHSSSASERYKERLPAYPIAQCPICKTVSVEALDTHSLAGWRADSNRWEYIYLGRRAKLSETETTQRFRELERKSDQSNEDWKRMFSMAPYRGNCRHFLAVQFFINLHDVVPLEMVYFSNQSEVPYVMPVFLPDDVESYAVMHSLPICRIEQDRFVPRYSLYILTYYSKDVHAMWDRRRAEFTGGDGMHFPRLHTWRRARDTPEVWDLPLWVRKGKLLWLDLEQDDLPLKAGPVEAFPYGNIEGIRKSYTYRKGKLKIDPY